MPDPPTFPDPSSAEIESVENASRLLLAVLGPGGFRARVERRVVDRSPESLLGRSRELVVDGVVVWRARWVADGSVARLHTQWLVDPESL